MVEIHCHSCGGFIGDPRRISYRFPLNPAHVATPHTRLCSCSWPIVYGPPPGYLSSPGVPSKGHHGTWQARANDTLGSDESSSPGLLGTAARSAPGPLSAT